MTPATCPSCGYDLRGTSDGDCPECGISAEERARIIAVRARARATPGMMPATLSILVAVVATMAFGVSFYHRGSGVDWVVALQFSLFVSLPLGCALILAVRGVQAARQRSMRVWSCFAICVVLGCFALVAGHLVDRLLW